MYVDVNNDFQFTDTIEVVHGITERTLLEIAEVGIENGQGYITLGAVNDQGPATALSIGSGQQSFVAGGRITKYDFGSEGHFVFEVKPVILAVNSGEGNLVPENNIGAFTVQAFGPRAVQLTKMRFEVSGSYDVRQGYGPKRFQLDRADRQGNRIVRTMNNGDTLQHPTLLYRPAQSVPFQTFVYADYAVGTSLFELDNPSGFSAGDRVMFDGDTNDGVGYLISSIDGIQVTLVGATQQPIQSGTGAYLVLDNPIVGDDSLLESGSVIEFNIADALIEEVAAGSSRSYVLVADTTNIKDTIEESSATTRVRMLGTKAALDETNALSWRYTRTIGARTPEFTISDSYQVSTQPILY